MLVLKIICPMIVAFQFFVSILAHGTLIIPTPIDKQVRESQAAIVGINNGKVYKKDKDGNVFTEFVFKVKKCVGIAPNEMINKNSFKVLSPGGKWNGKVYRTVGAPTFELGKNYVLLLDKTPYGFVTYGLSLGQYELLNEGGKKILRSLTFPQNPRIGTINYDDFDDLLQAHFGSKLEDTIVNDTSIFIRKDHKNKRQREIASLTKDTDTDSGNEEEGELSLLWLALLFGVLGIYTVFQVNRKKY